jgi:ABC-2 type transport system permease protein
MNKWLNNAGKFAIADLKAFKRDGQALFWTFFFPIMFMGLLGVVFGNAQVIDLKIGVINEDGSPASDALAHQIDGLENVKVIWYNATGSDWTGPNATAAAALNQGDIAVYIIIPANYNATLAAHSGGGSNNTTSVPPALIKVFYANDNTGNGRIALTVLSQVIGQVNFAVLEEQPVIVAAPQEVSVSRGRYIDYLVPGILAMNAMFSGVFNIAVVMTTMRQKGILRRLKVTPVSKSAILAAMITTRMLVIFISMAMILGIGVFAFGVQLQGNMALLVFVVIIGSLAFTTFGFAVSAYAKTVESAEAIANTVAMPMMFLGDVFLPVANMPAFIQPIAAALPLSYLGKALREVALQGHGLVEIALPLRTVVLYGLIGFAIAIKLFRWE